MGRVANSTLTRPIALPSWFHPAHLAGLALAFSVSLSFESQRVCALLAIIVLGVPHGALDGEIARSLLQSRFGRAWFPVFSLPYLSLFALVLLAWHFAPMPTLAAFLGASAWHFGSEDAPGTRLAAIIRGGLPIAVPLLAHLSATWAVFATVSGVSRSQPPDWLWAAGLIWLALGMAWAGSAVMRGQGYLLMTPALLSGVFVMLPPLTAFAIYFVCVHAPAHTAALIQDPQRALRVRDNRSAVVLALPITILTLLIGAALWPFYTGILPDRLLALTLQGLAALTLPHMLLDAWMTTHLTPRPCSSARGRKGATL